MEGLRSLGQNIYVSTIHDNILKIHQRDWHSMLLDFFWRIHIRIAYYACIGTEMPEKGSSQRRSSPTCVEGGGCCASVSSQPPVDPCAGGEAEPVCGLRHPHTTHHQLMGGRQAKRTERAQPPAAANCQTHSSPASAGQRGRREGNCGHTLLRLSVNVIASFLLLWISRKPWKY